MKEKIIARTAILIFVMIIFLLGVNVAFGKDNLILYGIIKGINSKKQEITIDVKSGGCFGIRTFHIDLDRKELKELKKLKKDIIGKRVIFSLDSSVCDDQTEHTIKIVPPKGGL